MTAAGFENHRPLRPRSIRIMTYRRLRHNFNLRHTECSLTVTCTDTVTTRISTSNYQHMLAFCRDAFLLRNMLPGQHAVLLCQHLHGKMNTFQFTSGDIQIACLRRTRTNTVCIKSFGKVCHVDIGINLESDSFCFHHCHTAVDYRLAELKIRNTKPQQASHVFQFFEHRHRISSAVQLIGSRQSCRSGTDDSHRLPVSFILTRLYIPFTKSSFNDSGFIFTNGYRCIHTQLQHTTLFTQCRTYTASELRKIIGSGKYLISFFPFSLVHGILELRRTIAQRACPMAERYTTVHTPRCLELSLACVQCLFHFTEVHDTVVYRTVSGLLSGNGQKCFWISHISSFLLFNN